MEQQTKRNLDPNTLNIDGIRTYDDLWKEARLLQEAWNANKSEFHEPHWSFDCSFKLDFDGEILGFSSRFYPPAIGYGENTWSGSISVVLLGKVVETRDFEDAYLPNIIQQAEAFKQEVANRIFKALYPEHEK